MDTFHKRPTARDLAQQEERFDAFLDRLEYAATESDLTPEKRKQRRAYVASGSTEAERERRWVKTYFPHVFTLPWNDGHVHISQMEAGGHFVSGFRKSGKTAYAMVGKVLRPIAEGAGGMIAVCVRTQDLAKERTHMLFRMLKQNTLVGYDHELRVDQAKKGHYIINGTHLVGGSVQKGLRSQIDENFSRFHTAVCDDLYDRTTVDSDADNEDVYEFVVSEVDGQMEDDGLYVVLGNMITDGCPMAMLAEDFPDRRFSLPALDDDGNSTWPAYKTADEWHEKRDETAPDVWAGDYMDDPLVYGDTLQESWLRTVNIATVQIVASITAIDPARGSSPAACYKGGSTLGLTSSDNVVMLAIYSRKESWASTFDWCRRQHQSTPSHSVILFEDDFAQWDFAEPYYKQWMESRGSVLPFVLITTDDLVTAERGQSKVARIMNLVHPHQVGRFLYDASITGSADWQQYRKDFLAFGEKTTGMDALDATATAFIKLRSYSPTNRTPFKSTGTRRFEKPRWTGFR
mgnify:CR=1 FL=1